MNAVEQTSIWKNNIFVRVYTSAFVSSMGDRLVLFILPLWVMSITNSSFFVAIVNATITATTVLFTPFTGTMADRFSRRKLMIAADILRVIVMVVMVIIASGNFFSLSILLLLLIFRSFGTALSSPAANAALVTFVEKEHIEDAVALRQTMNQLVSIAGPLLGGILVGFISYKGIFAIDAFTFLLSIIILLSLKFPKDISLTKQKTFWEDMKEGIYVIVGNPLLKVLFIAAVCINILGSSLFLCLQVFVVRDMNLSAFWWGIVFASSPVGVIIGSLLSKKMKRGNNIVSFSFIFIFVVGCINVFMGFTVNPWLFSFLYFISGIAFGISNVYFGVLYREMVPAEKQGRFFGFLNSILLISTPIGITVTGLILEELTASILIIIIGTLTVLTAVISYILILRQESI